MRVAAVRYINALPLIYGLESHPSVELSYQTPADCYQRLIHNDADVGLIPLIGIQTNSQARAIKGLGIASTNRCESVYVFARKPLGQVRDVITDAGSMTSVMLLRIILRQKYNNSPRFDSQKIDNIYTALKAHDAVLLIGDGAILTEKSDYDHYDLASEWYSLTRLPFVFAVWAAAHPLSESEKQILNDAYAQATQNWEKIYRQAQETLPVERGFLERYYRENLRYQLSRSDYEGIARFFSYAAELGFLENVRKDVWM